MLLYETNIRKEHGNVSILLRKLGFTPSIYCALKSKKTDVYHEDGETFQLKNALEEKGFVIDDGKKEVTVL